MKMEAIVKPTIMTVSAISFVAFVLVPNKCHATLSFAGDAYVEVSTSQTSPIYTAAGARNGNVTSGSDLGNLGGTITIGQSLYLGGQIQDYQPAVGTTTTLFYRIGTSGSYSSLNLPYYQTANDNDWWDSNGSINSTHTYTSADVSSSLASGANTVDFYYEVDQNGNILYNASSSSPYSFEVTVVPEPIRTALGMFGGLAVLWWALGLCWKRPEANQ
jgi:hypothetical protein